MAIASKLASAALGAALGVGLFSEARARKAAWFRFALRLGALLPGGFVLQRVRVPVALLSGTQECVSLTDWEGLVECDVHIANGTVKAVCPAGKLGRLQGVLYIDFQGTVLFTCFVETHSHMIKTHTVTRICCDSSSNRAPLALEVNDQQRWAAEGDIARRMDFALRTAWHNGTRAVRTHLDGVTGPHEQLLRAEVYSAFTAARAVWQQRGLVLQGVANLWLPLYLNPHVAEAHATYAAQHEGVILGAFCGKQDENTEAAFDSLFAQASKHGLDVDLHIDASGDADCCAVVPLCASLAKARAGGYRGHVLLGHLMTLSLQCEDTRTKVLNALTALKPLTVVCCPRTNLAAGDRRGFSKDVPADMPHTPRWRGLTLVQELRAAGVHVAAGSDNVRDSWYHYGDYDGLAVWASALAVGHLDDPNPGVWADLVTNQAAQALGVGTGSLLVGSPVNLVLFPSARRISELLARPQQDRIVLRDGLVQSSLLPDFREIDDLQSRL